MRPLHTHIEGTHAGLSYDGAAGLLTCWNDDGHAAVHIAPDALVSMARAAAREVKAGRLRDTPHKGLGQFPKRLNTVTAGVLAWLLGGGDMTGLEAVYGASTTRLADCVYRLGKDWGWIIASEEFDHRCNDGHMAKGVSRYYLSAEIIEAANSVGAQDWCASVQSARADLRRRTKTTAGVVA